MQTNEEMKANGGSEEEETADVKNMPEQEAKEESKEKRTQAQQDDAESPEADIPEELTPEEKLAALSQAVIALEKERDEYMDIARRIKAEFENFKRRNSAVRSEAWEDGARETIALILPVIDNLERALDAAKDKTPLRDGVELVHRQVMSLLDNRGVTVIDRLGEPFDPELENAVMQAGSGEGEPGTVCGVLQKGYRTNKRVIRHAMVCVVAAE